MSLTVFDFQSQIVRVVMQDGQPWWVASDVCAVLELDDTSKAVSRLDEDEKGTNNIRTPGGNQDMLCVNEPGLYALVLTSRKPQAKAFKRWLTHEVIPSIRARGSYQLPQQPAPTEQDNFKPQSQIEIILASVQQLAATAQQMAEQEHRLLHTEHIAKELTLQLEVTKDELKSRIEAVEKEQDRFNHPSGHKYTILGFAKKQGLEISLNQSKSLGSKASSLCKTVGIAVERISDPRFGSVGLYPESILIQVFG